VADEGDRLARVVEPDFGHDLDLMGAAGCWAAGLLFAIAEVAH
jgi:hypothetical protein